MNIEGDFWLEMKNISSVCGIDCPPNIEIRKTSGEVASEFDENTGNYIVYHPLERRIVGCQDTVLHESAHILNIHYQKSSNQLIDLNTIRNFVIADWGSGIVADNFLNYCSETFSRYFSTEMVACYFGLDRSNAKVLKEASDYKNEVTFNDLKEVYLQMKKGNDDLVTAIKILNESGINTRKDDMILSHMVNQFKKSRSLGEGFGLIFGQWFVVENILPKEIMTHTPFKLMKGLEQLLSLDKFPEQISDVFREANSF